MLKKNILYFPLEHNDGWNYEVNKLLPWLYGHTLDIGSGERSIKITDVRVDIDEKLEPDVIASGDKLPLDNETFDSLYAIHAIEHFKDTKATLKEWLRVLRGGGIIGMIVPDRFYTGTQYKHVAVGDQSQFMIHEHEWKKEEFISEMGKLKDLGFEIVDSGVALGNWSFYVILRKNI